jgi:hypothetical protein
MMCTTSSCNALPFQSEQVVWHTRPSLQELFEPGGNELYLRPARWLIGKVRQDLGGCFSMPNFHWVLSYC